MAPTPVIPVEAVLIPALPPTKVATVDPNWLQDKARDLERSLRQYSIGVCSIDAAAADIGPSVVRYKVRLRPGETIARFQRIAEDLARELALSGPPFIDNIPGTHFVGVDLPRPTPEVVELLPLLVQLGQPEPTGRAGSRGSGGVGVGAILAPLARRSAGARSAADAPRSGGGCRAAPR